MASATMQTTSKTETNHLKRYPRPPSFILQAKVTTGQEKNYPENTGASDEIPSNQSSFNGQKQPSNQASPNGKNKLELFEDANIISGHKVDPSKLPKNENMALTNIAKPKFPEGSASLGRSGKFFRAIRRDDEKRSEAKNERKPTESPSSTISKDSASDAKASGSKFAAKLSKSFYDLTSSERLKSWKAKLPSVKQSTGSGLPKPKKKAETRDIQLPVVPVPPAQPVPHILDTAPETGTQENPTNLIEESTYDLALGSYAATEHRSIIHDNNARRRFAEIGAPPIGTGRNNADLSTNKNTYQSDVDGMKNNSFYGQNVRSGPGVRNLFSSVKPPLFKSSSREESFEKNFLPDTIQVPSNVSSVQRRHSETTSVGSLSSLNFNPQETPGRKNWGYQKFSANNKPLESVLRESKFNADRGNLNKKYRHSVGVLLANTLYDSESPPNRGQPDIRHILPPTESTSKIPAFMEHRTKKQKENQAVFNSNRNYEEVPDLPSYKPPLGGYRPPPAYQPPPPPAPLIGEHNRTVDSLNISFGDDGGAALPPPARITPYSGVPQTEDGAIVRPIAFKPVTSSKQLSHELTPDRSPMIGKAPTTNYFSSPEVSRSGRFRPLDLESDTSSSIYGITGPQPFSNMKHQGYGFSSPQKYVSDSEAMYKQQGLSSVGQKYPSDTEAIWQPNTQLKAPNSPYLNARAKPATSGASPGSTYSSPAMARRPKPVYQSPSVASGPPTYQKPANQKNSGSSSSDYDLVPEFLDFSQNLQALTSPPSKPRRFPVAGGVVISSGPETKTTDSAFPNVPAHKQKQVEIQRPSPGSITGHGQGYGTTGSHGSRQSSGIHVTPSPSDSGVAELEAALREKESELLKLRDTMEQNEEVIIKVYQEKEEKWQTKMKEWSERLEHSVNTEQRLLTQIQRLQDDRNSMHGTVQNLSAEKHGLQRKCKELENELFAVKEQLDGASKHWAICRRCGDIFMPDLHGKDTEKHNYVENSDDRLLTVGNLHVDRRSSNDSVPTPTLLKPPPRSSRDSGSNTSNKSPTPNDDLRTEIEALRGEVHGLRDSLQQQMSAFAQERNRWDEEKQKVIEYQKVLQQNYVQVFHRNQELEDRVSGSSRTSSIIPHDNRTDREIKSD